MIILTQVQKLNLQSSSLHIFLQPPTNPISPLSPSNVDACDYLPFNLPSGVRFSLGDVLFIFDILKKKLLKGPDVISVRLLYIYSHSIMYPILFICSLDKEICPCVWKICSITPILKSGDPFNVKNFSPISILPHLAKIFEYLVYSYIKRSFNLIIIDEQHGFRSDQPLLVGLYLLFISLKTLRLEAK